MTGRKRVAVKKTQAAVNSAKSTTAAAEPFCHWRIGDTESICSSVLAELKHDTSRFLLRMWNGQPLALEPDATHFGFVFSGQATLKSVYGDFRMSQGMYFSLPSSGSMESTGAGIAISQFDYRALFQLGGPIEEHGRLPYIDGCSDTLLISPVVRGEACLNLLYLPPNTTQTAHTHPSFRAGVVAAGEGICQTELSSVPITAGSVFTIEAGGLHSFHTTDESLTVIAFHPDSDFGPWHDDHPMVNRTIVDGMPAAKLSLAERGIEQDVR